MCVRIDRCGASLSLLESSTEKFDIILVLVWHWRYCDKTCGCHCCDHAAAQFRSSRRLHLQKINSFLNLLNYWCHFRMTFDASPSNPTQSGTPPISHPPTCSGSSRYLYRTLLGATIDTVFRPFFSTILRRIWDATMNSNQLVLVSEVSVNFEHQVSTSYGQNIDRLFFLAKRQLCHNLRKIKLRREAKCFSQTEKEQHDLFFRKLVMAAGTAERYPLYTPVPTIKTTHAVRGVFVHTGFSLLPHDRFLCVNVKWTKDHL